ncbi:MAG: hypothetical protein ACO1SV_04760 [Fimbriimonas sp.]
MSTEGPPPPILDPAVEPNPEAPRAPTAAEIAWAELQQTVASGASWFTWIALLSIVNAVLVFVGSPIGLAIGFIFTDGAVAYSKEGGGAGWIVIALVIVALFFGLGLIARRGARWAFVVGILLLILDALLGFMDLAGQILSIAIHLWAIWNMTSAIFAIGKLKKMSRGEAI